MGEEEEDEEEVSEVTLIINAVTYDVAPERDRLMNAGERL